MGAEVEKIHENSRKIYGTRRIRQELMAEGKTISRKRVGRLMKQQNLRAKGKRKFKATTNSNHSLPVAPNLLNRKFQINRPDTIYVSDITYIPTDEG
ncbi:MAG: IS3 family transposase [Candidatus Thiodiazotropha sp. (ex Lucinoma aequizonata)]|nr:IS3 family transposase [Candidatus Thiodiazotropha sp. (ex Lucinoma aequizonata)]